VDGGEWVSGVARRGRRAGRVMQFSGSGLATRRDASKLPLCLCPAGVRSVFIISSRCLKVSILSFIPWLFIYAAINNGSYRGSSINRQPRERTYF